MTGPHGDAEQPGDSPYAAAQSGGRGQRAVVQDQDAVLSEATLRRAGLERAASMALSGAFLYDDQRQEVGHLLSQDEAQAIARRRLGLPRLPQHMNPRELLDLCLQQRAEIARLSRDVEQARRLVYDMAARHADVRATLYEVMDKIQYYWLDDLP